MVEQIGSGIIRMNDLMKEACLPEPIFSIEGMFTVTLKRPLKTSEKTVEKTSEKTSEKILRLIKDSPQITINELSEKIGKSTRNIEMQIQKLKAQQKIVRIGPDKGGYWEVKSEQKGK